MNKTYIFFKETNTDTEVAFDLELNNLETIVSIVPSPVSPISTPPLTVVLTSGIDSNVRCLLKQGMETVSYGIPVIVTTDQRIFTVVIAVQVSSSIQQPYATANSEAFSDLVDTIQVGNAAIGTAVFVFPLDIDPSNGYVIYELLDSDGTVYSAGNAYDYTITVNQQHIVTAKSVISVPSTVPVGLLNQKYQLRYTLLLDDPQNVQQQYYSYENITVTGLSTVPLGTQPVVEMVGDQATLSLVTNTLYANLGLEIYSQNELIGPFTQLVDYERVSGGYFWSANIMTSELKASLQPLNVVWKYWNSDKQIFRESSQLYIVNPSIMTAVDDVRSKINKARTSLYGTQDTQFPTTEVLVWLRRAMDSFNAAYGVFTSFTMTNAMGPVREFWLMMAELAAMSAQYLSEGEKAFNFQGAAISLDVDRTQYLEAAMSRIQSVLDAELKPLKQNLIIKGAMMGDGSIDPSKLQMGAIGSVGITISPASPWGAYMPGLNRFR